MTQLDKPKKKLGRPTIYRVEMCEVVIDLMKEGGSKVEVMAALGIQKHTFYEWVEKHTSFGDTVKEGEGLCQAWWEAKGRLNIENKEFNSTLWYMNMKNRFGWRDKQEQTVNLHLNPAEALKYLE